MENFPYKTGAVEIKGRAKGGKVKVVRFDRSFLSRIIQTPKAKGFYDEIKNYILSFEKVKSRLSWNAESFAVGGETVVRLIVTAGALCALLALSPDGYDYKEYPHKDYSSRAEYRSTPFFLPIRSAAEYKTARRMVAETLTTRCIYPLTFPVRADYAAELPMQKDDALVRKGFIKKSESEMSEADAKKAIAAAIKAEAEEEQELEDFGKPRERTKKLPKAEVAPVAEPESEEIAAEEEAEEVEFELAEDGSLIEVYYDRSFTARIIQNEKAKAYYDEIKNYALSFGVKSRLSWRGDRFYLGRVPYFIAKVRGKTLRLYLALDPTAYEDRIYHQADVSEIKCYQKTPMMIRVRSDLGLRRAKTLIEEMLSASGFAETETVRVDYVAKYPYEEDEALLERGLIKKVERKAGEPPFAEEPEEVEFELAEEHASDEEPEEVTFELAEEGEDEDVEEVTFELADADAPEAGMESYGAEGKEGRYVTLRKYSRGFVAKLKQGEGERKDYYAEIKAKLLSYQGVKVSESFSGDAFKKGARALLKSRIRGKTLCLFFALNPDNYKQTIYRQQYKGDVKAYAATPMMVRVRSEQGFKRALRLVEDMERNYLLQAGDPVTPLSVRAAYSFEETNVLVEKGLIKTKLVTVTEYEAEALLKKKAR